MSGSHIDLIKKMHISSCKLDYNLGKTVCSDLCNKTVLLLDDVSYNLIPLEGMLLEEWSIKSALF